MHHVYPCANGDIHDEVQCTDMAEIMGKYCSCMMDSLSDLPFE